MFREEKDEYHLGHSALSHTRNGAGCTDLEFRGNGPKYVDGK